VRWGIFGFMAATLVGGAAGMGIPQKLQQDRAKAAAQPSIQVTENGNAKLEDIARRAEYRNRPFRDFLLTGSNKARAEWNGADGGICGIEPYLRYVIVENSIGATRYDADMPSQRRKSFAQKMANSAQEIAAGIGLFVQSPALGEVNGRRLIGGVRPTCRSVVATVP
jgi:hypothetical protein